MCAKVVFSVMNENLTRIGRIGIVKRTGSEWSSFSKKFVLPDKPDFAAIRVDSYGVCGIYVNGVFLEATTGRYSNRIAYFECTSLLKNGENEIKLVLGNHFYQTTSRQIFERSGAMFSCVAAELQVRTGSSTLTIVTDENWQCISDDCVQQTVCFSEVTKAEYQRFWLSAALWEEQSKNDVHEAVLRVAGKAYDDYIHTPAEKYVVASKIADGSAFATGNGCLQTDVEQEPYVIFDLGKLFVGYVELQYQTDGEANVKILFDYSESCEDFSNGNGIVERLTIKEPLKKGSNTLFVLRRRAGRFIKLQFDGTGHVRIDGVKIYLSMKPYSAQGWFSCEDELLNKAWEVGKYTLQVNKHQEYESCPRNEMKYFAGDAIIEALVDYYAFGDGSLVDASLSLTEIDSNSGIRHDRYSRHASLWDYPAWRILTAYNHYLYFGDTYFVKKYFDELAINMEWMIDKMNSRGLIYQFPCFSPPMYNSSSPLEYNSSTDRLGEKPLLNALLYQSLVCMSEFAQILSDARGEVWRTLAYKVKAAFNSYLWSEEKGAFLDQYDTEYIPQDGNAVAVRFGLANEERAMRTLETVKKENWTPYGSSIISSDKRCIRGRIGTISPVMNMYEAEARFLCGDDAGALELIRACWGGMLKKGAETFWEFVPNSAVERWPIPSHGWASGCTYLLSAYVLGIRPLAPGCSEVLFDPSRALDCYCGVVPTAKGVIAIRKEKEKYTLSIPKGLKLSARLNPQEQLEITEYESEIL